MEQRDKPGFNVRFYMNLIYLSFGLALGIFIGAEYFKYRILKVKDKEFIKKVKEWISEAEK